MRFDLQQSQAAKAMAEGAHLMARLPITVAPGGSGHLALRLVPEVLDADGHVSGAALGVFIDLASSFGLDQAVRRPFVHADITVRRLGTPRGGVVVATSRALRQGGRTGVVEVDVVDGEGAAVATSVQEIVFLGPLPDTPDAPAATGPDDGFWRFFDGRSGLEGHVADGLGARRVDGPEGPWWEVEPHPSRSNMMDALHGGVLVGLVDLVAAGVGTDVLGAPARTSRCAVRYLKPAQAGPFAVRPTVLHHDEGRRRVVLRVGVHDAEGRLCVAAEAEAEPVEG